ncbi:type VII secretion-associated serine protease mycosin [Longispora urticae]
MISARRVLAAVATGVVAAALAVPGAAIAEPTLREKQWYVDALKIPDIHSRGVTGKGVTVAVLDSGVDAEHPSLSGQVLPGLDLTGEGTDGRKDVQGHGTHMAGIIAAKGGTGPNNVLGIAPGAKILPIRIAVKDDLAKSDVTAQAIRAAADRGAKVINMSFDAQGLPPQVLQDAVRYALDKDVVLVAAAGNRSAGDSFVGFPANTPGVIAVTGLDKQGAFWSGSVQGPESVLSAPAERITNIDSRTVPDATGFATGDGTSDASAIVAGTAALVREKFPSLNAVNVINRLLATSEDIDPKGRDPQYGFGRVFPMRAVTDPVPNVATNPLLTAQASATPSAKPSGAGFPDEQRPPANGAEQTEGSSPVLWIVLGVVLVLVIAVVVFLVLRRGRKSPPAAPQGGPFPGGPGQSGGWPAAEPGQAPHAGTGWPQGQPGQEPRTQTGFPQPPAGQGWPQPPQGGTGGPPAAHPGAAPQSGAAPQPGPAQPPGGAPPARQGWPPPPPSGFPPEQR